MKEANFFEEPKDVTEAMRQSLARSYADVDFRAYLVRTIQASHQNALTLLDAGKSEDARFHANRAKVFKQLLDKGKEYFIHFEAKGRKINVLVDSPDHPEIKL